MAEPLVDLLQVEDFFDDPRRAVLVGNELG
jgi:hypothetical protein